MSVPANHPSAPDRRRSVRAVPDIGPAGQMPVQWDGPPTPLSPARMLPPFPVDVFPAWVRDQVEAVTVFNQTPPDLAGCIALAALSTAAGGRAVVEVRAGWREPVNLFTVVALPPGSRKSPVFKALTGPILAAEQALAEQVAGRIDEATLTLRVAQANAEKLARAAEHGTGDAFADALGGAAEVRGITVPVLPRLVADDITPETATSLLAEQSGRLAVLSAEGGIFATIAGRYSGTPNLEVFLKGHAGDMMRVDRKGRDAEHITAPALTLGLAVQPEVLKDIAAMPGFRGRGLLGRILYSLPVNTVGRRQIGPPAPTEDVLNAYSEHLCALVLTLADWTDPAVLTLTPEAAQEVLRLETELEPRLAPGAGLAHITDWASKLIGATTRLAGLLHLAEHTTDGWTRPVSAETMHGAARLGTYYLAHALAVFDLMGSDPTIEDARVVLDWLNRTGLPVFTRRDAHVALPRSRFPKATDLDGPLALLEETGWIRHQDPPASSPKGGRPPSPKYDVHPDASQPAPS